MTEDARLYAPSAARNREPILNVLRTYLPQRGLVLEIASGSGEHVTFFAAASPAELVFQPTDLDEAARASTDAWTAELGLANIRPAIPLDAASDVWPVERADVVVCINMIHISPWDSAVGLVRGAARVLPPDGVLFLYGPYRRADVPTAPSNDEFDLDLKRRNPAWGLRDLEAVAAVAKENGFAPPVVVEMPSNNLCVIFRRTA
ncbi:MULTISPECIES: DUF938 domain-containing protein [Rhodomicrobium]|uniref:DUF938 domain-containing protein n=1 Tax=Rhodomicrobium TaxID=1068 RepID=UPI000B4AD36E|nr:MULTISPECIES: DUF938 domain-containing protein [Rhodomicrobium]